MEKVERDQLIEEAKSLGYNPPSNIGDETLAKKVAELKANSTEPEANQVNDQEGTDEKNDSENVVENDANEANTGDTQVSSETTAVNEAENTDPQIQEVKTDFIPLEDEEPKLNNDGFIPGQLLSAEDLKAYQAKQKAKK